MTTYTLFGQQATGSSLAADPTAYTLGVQFSVSQSGGTLTGIWFYSPPGAGVLPQTIALYDTAGPALVHSEPATWSGPAGSGWVRAAFASPPSLAATTNYKGCVLQATAANWYSATAHYWDTGAGSSGITDGPLSAPDNAGSVNGQDCFNQNSVLGYPGNVFNASNYWLDAEVGTPATGGAVYYPRHHRGRGRTR